MADPVWLYRHDSIVLPRPYGVDVDADGWLWEGTTANRLIGHHLDTGELRVIELPQMDGHVVFCVWHWDGKLVLVLGHCPYYLVYDLASGDCQRHAIPGPQANCWYGTWLDPGRLMICDRGNGQALILDAPDAEPRVVRFPYEGDFNTGTLLEDGLVYTFLTAPSRMARFDPGRERFVDETPLPFDAAITFAFTHDGVLYGADSSGGRILRMVLKTQRWLEPVAHPDHGSVFGFIGSGFRIGSKGYYALSTYAHRSRLDLKTGKIILPPEGTPWTVDGRPPRFMERMLVFDAETLRFEYLEAPPQPDGVPLLCYAWTDGQRFAVTGLVLPFDAAGVATGNAARQAGPEPGPWIVLQNQPTRCEPFGGFDFRHDRIEQMHRRRRRYPATNALYLPHPEHSPPIANQHGPASEYDLGVHANLVARAGATDGSAYWSRMLQAIVPPASDDATIFRRILGHVYRTLYYNPIQMPPTRDPIVAHEAREGRCGHGVEVTLALCEAAGLEARLVNLQNHQTAEVRYDNTWHMADALFFGPDQPQRDGQVLSVEQLRAEPYLADACPQWSFAYDPEMLMSEDGYQVLGYVFGPWGAEPYYSYYLGAPKAWPPTLPGMMPAQRLEGDMLRLNWGRSIKHHGPDAAIEYELRVFRDRACRKSVLCQRTGQTHFDFAPPESNWMYFMEVRAMDDHRRLQPDTWYPPARWNFVLVPSEQYGWYGVT